MPEEQFVAELVREQLLAVTRDELPYSIATRVTEAARSAGMEPDTLVASRDWEEIAARVLAGLGRADRVLVKGSRAMRMERIVEHLRDGAGGDTGGER